jgi:hypothetical protein
LTPGISTGYWNARNTPSRGALVGIHLEQVLAVVQHLAAGDLVARDAGEHRASVLLPEPFGPHDGVHFAGVHVTVRSMPLRISDF